MVNVSVLAVDNCMKSSITGPHDIWSVASIQWRQMAGKASGDLFHVQIITGTGKPVRCFNGTVVEPDQGMSEDIESDVVFIPVIYGSLEPLLNDGPMIDWLILQHQRGAVICAVCAGVFLAAQTGLLENRCATTHWHLAREFQQRFPGVTLKQEKMVVDEGDFITAGGVTAYMDLSLHLCSLFGSRELSANVSKILLIDPARQSQSPYQAFHFNLNHGDKPILKVQEWMQQHASDPMTVPALADRAGLGHRTFNRRFKKATGDTPLEYLQQLRIDMARNQLVFTRESIDTITYATGYEDVSSFRRLFKRATGLSPTAYRRKFRRDG
ncbi:MAG: GlxA family transcriptional regulator [Desulfobacteraceae bacterium]|nr:MAG: GlxA family transcriptional regulator [Desulfobacteraceae bacterium]